MQFDGGHEQAIICPLQRDGLIQALGFSAKVRSGADLGWGYGQLPSAAFPLNRHAMYLLIATLHEFDACVFLMFVSAMDILAQLPWRAQSPGERGAARSADAHKC